MRSSANKLAYMVEYNRKNRKRILMRQRAYRRNNLEKVRAQELDWSRRNRDKKRKSAAASYRKHRNKRLRNRALYVRKNYDKVHALDLAYNRKNRKRRRDYARAYRANNFKKTTAQRRTIATRHGIVLTRHRSQLIPRGIKGKPLSLKAHHKKLFYADGRERPCWYCLGENNKQGSGLDRLNNSITYTAKNTVPACRGCNVWRGFTHTVEETRKHFKPMRDAARNA